MRKTSFLFILVTLFLGSSAFMPQPVVEDKSFQDGEWFKFRIHYGIFNASFATLSVAETALNGKAVYHVKGHGESTGMLDWFCTTSSTSVFHCLQLLHWPCHLGACAPQF